MRKILAMKFRLESPDKAIIELIAWLKEDGNGKFVCPAHPAKCLLDVRVGDVLTFMGKEHLVLLRLKPYRTTECKDDTEYSDITCGTEWEQRE